MKSVPLTSRRDLLKGAAAFGAFNLIPAKVLWGAGRGVQHHTGEGSVGGDCALEPADARADWLWFDCAQ